MSTWRRPKPKMYEYNYQIQSSQYRPVISILEEKDAARTKSQVQVTSRPTKSSDVLRETTDDPPRPRRRPRVPEPPPKKFDFYSPKSTAGYIGPADTEYERFKKESSEALQRAKKTLEEMEERKFPQKEPLWKVHPYYVPVDLEQVPPHESSIWPENRKHFDLVSSYDLMVGFLGIKGMAEREMTKNVKRDE